MNTVIVDKYLFISSFSCNLFTGIDTIFGFHVSCFPEGYSISITGFLTLLFSKRRDIVVLLYLFNNSSEK